MSIEQNIVLSIKQLTAEKIERFKHKKSIFVSSEFLSGFGNFEGCSLEEVIELMHIQNVEHLPNLYKVFLLEFGKNNGGIIEVDGYHQLKNVKRYLIHLLYSEGNIITLPDNVFVFFNNSGTCLDFFYTHDVNDDPPVYRYCEGNDNFIQIESKLSKWFTNHLQVRRSHNNNIF